MKFLFFVSVSLANIGQLFANGQTKIFEKYHPCYLKEAEERCSNFEKVHSSKFSDYLCFQCVDDNSKNIIHAYVEFYPGYSVKGDLSTYSCSDLTLYSTSDNSLNFDFLEEYCDFN